ncbi:hypothetical protein KFL_000050530 [Klebsormidium nitens]|uniref:Uncharacterized protein n=1 Tax=Klebsormidium nitens TaxID=105231 RepID=A0A1Y1HMZ6_KLENI|nr:hypothetical protein KFL_000050530 [Klebsormidium nitens]|eukprot:GAQ77917.1 hypothetical protein KFL_000050530 [Klebsormidium nitens]
MFRSEQNLRTFSTQSIADEEEADSSPLLSSQNQSKQRKGSNLRYQSGLSQGSFVSYGNTSFEVDAEVPLPTETLRTGKEWPSGIGADSGAGTPRELSVQEASDLLPLFGSNHIFSSKNTRKPNPLFIAEEAQASNPLFFESSSPEVSPSPRHPVTRLLSAEPPLSKENSRDNPVYSPAETPRDSPSSSFASLENYQLRSFTVPDVAAQLDSISASMTVSVSDQGWQDSEGAQHSRRSSKQQVWMESGEGREGDSYANTMLAESLSLSGPLGNVPLSRKSSATRYGPSRQPSVDSAFPGDKDYPSITSQSRMSHSGPLQRDGSSLKMEPISHSPELEVQQKPKSRRASKGDLYTGSAMGSQRLTGDMSREAGEPISEKAAESALVDISELEQRGTAVPRGDWQHLFGSQGADQATVVTIEADYTNGYDDTQISRQGSRPLSKRPSLSGPILSTTRNGRDSAYSSQNVTPSAAGQKGVTSLSRAGSQAGEDGEKRPRRSLTLKRVSDGQGEEENGRERTPSAEKKSRWLRSHPVDRGLAALNDDEESGTVSRTRLGKATPGEIAMVSLEAATGGGGPETLRIARKLSDSSTESQPASPSGDHPMRGSDAAFEPLVPLKPLKPLKIIPNQVVMPVRLQPAPAPARKQKRFWEKSAFRWSVALGVIVLVIVVVAVLA